MKKILLLSAILLGAVSVSQAGLHLHLGLPLPPLPPLPGVSIGIPAPVYGSAYSYGPDYCPPAVVVRPPIVRFGYPYYGHYNHGPYYRGGYYHGYRGGYRGSYHHGRW